MLSSASVKEIQITWKSFGAKIPKDLSTIVKIEGYLWLRETDLIFANNNYII